MGTAIKHPERQSARMSKITNDGLTQSGTGRISCTHMATVGVRVKVTWLYAAAAGIIWSL